MISAKAGSNPYKGYGVVSAKAGCPDLNEDSDDEPPELIDSEEEPIVVSAKAGSNRRGSAHPDFIFSDCLSDTDEDEDGNGESDSE